MGYTATTAVGMSINVKLKIALIIGKVKMQPISTTGRFPRNLEQAFPATMQSGAAISGPYRKGVKINWKVVFWVAVYIAFSVGFYTMKG